MARGLFETYLDGGARDLYRAHFADVDARARAVERARRPLAPAVFEALRQQQARLPASPARARNLEALGAGAAAVVTGQQVGLFLGPLYTLYKALTAVVAAERLTRETGTPVVPIFWVQSEDHDLPEVATFCCSAPEPEDSSPLEFRLPSRPEDRVSLEHQRLPTDTEAVLGALEHALHDRPFAAEHMARLRRHYRPGAGYAAAFTGLLAELTERYGLVFSNPRDPALAACAGATHERALREAAPIAELLVERQSQLQRVGFEAPVHVRPGAPLAFFHPEGPEGPRYRLIPAPGGFALQGGPSGTWTLAQLVERLHADPRSFSSSALLRPLVQDVLLPTAAYVGGPAEIAYLAQLIPVYGRFGLEPPLLLPRARFFVVEPEVRRTLDRLRLAAWEARGSEAELLARLAGEDEAARASDELESSVLGPLLEDLDARAAALSALGPGIERALRRTRESVSHNLGRFIGKVRAAELARDESGLRRVRQLRRALYPGGAPQERRLGLSEFAARHGDLRFVERVHESVDPFNPNVVELEP